MNKISADIIFPSICSPIKNGILIFDNDGKIMDLIDPQKVDYSIEEVNHYSGYVVPGFINTHCHLELSIWKGKVPKYTGLDEFLRLMSSQSGESFEDDQLQHAIAEAENEMLNEGIVAVGDISNTSLSFRQKSKSNLHYHSFLEVFGSAEKSSQNKIEQITALRDLHLKTLGKNCSIVPHAPYSLSQSLFQAVSNLSIDQISSIHFQENSDEIEYFLKGIGPCAERLKAFEIALPSLIPSGKRPIDSISAYMNRNQKVLFVHNLFSSELDIKNTLQLIQDPYWCFCPNANSYIQNELPDLSLFKNLKDKITIGTDSLASNDQLSILEELHSLFKSNSNLSCESLFRFATINGARFLDIDDQYGSFNKGKRPGVLNIEHFDLNQDKQYTVTRII